MSKLMAGLALAGLFAGSGVAVAKVSEAQAARLGQDLTPLGAEMAGNADGSIPAYEGGYRPDTLPPPERQRHHDESAMAMS